MNLLKTIIERLNQRVEVANIFDQIYPLCELNANGNEKAWVHYIGNGQAEVVTNFDAKQGTLFWAKRGKVSVTKTESLKVSGCKTLYLTSFPLTAYAVVRKSHLPCDSEDSQDWIASRIYRLISGTDPDFKVSIGVIQYEVIPNGYVNEIKSLTANYEWACVAVDVDVSVVSSSEDGCYDVCATGDIPLPDFQPCTPCLTEVAVDGVTIIGNGTTADPLVAIGGGGGSGIMTAIAFSTDHLSSTGNQYVIGNVVWYNGNIYRCIANNDSILPTNATYWTNLGAGFQTIERPIDWNSSSGNNQILNKPTIPILPATIVEDVTATAPLSSSGGATPDISITQADGTTDGYLSQTDWNTFDGKFNVPTGLSTDYLDGLGSPQPFPTIPNAQVNSDWNATSGVAEILNKPTIPVVTGFVPYTGATTDLDMGTHNVTADHIALNVSPSGAGFVVGATEWNNTIGSSQTLLKGGNVTLKNGVDLVARIVNKVTPNTTLTKASYQAVRVSGATGGRLSVKLAQADTDNNSADTIGLVCETIATNQEGFILTMGQLLDINTTGSLQGETWADGDVLYLSPTTAGRLTNIKPTGATGHIVVIGYVEYAHNSNGAIYVKIMNGWELDELHNIFISSPSNNDALIYESSTQLWKNKSLATALGYTPVTDARTISTTAPLTGGGDLTANRTFAITKATASVDGYLASTDFTTFNGKQDALTLTTTGTSGAATLVGSTLNIPQYSGGGGGVSYKTTTDQSAVTGVTTNVKVVSQLIPANTFAVGDIIQIKARVGKTGGAGIITLRVYVNSADSLTSPAPILIITSATSTIAQTYNGIDRNALIKTATNTQTVQANASVQNDAVVGNATQTNSNINWTIDQYIIFAIQNGSAADSSVLSYFQIQKQ